MTLIVSMVTVGLQAGGRTEGLVSSTVVHGSDCRGVYPGEHPRGTGIFHLGQGLRNTSPEWRYIVCPLPHRGGLADLEVHVTTEDALLTCMLMSYDRFGVSSRSSQALFAPGVGSQVLDFGSAGLEADEKDAIHVACNLPPGAIVHSIRLRQSR